MKNLKQIFEDYQLAVTGDSDKPLNVERVMFELLECLTYRNEIDKDLEKDGDLDKFRLHIYSGIDILEKKKNKIEQEYEIKQTEGLVEAGVNLDMMIKKTKECLEFNF